MPTLASALDSWGRSPVPLWPVLGGILPYSHETLMQDGLLLFVPIHMLREPRYAFRDLVVDLLKLKDYAHLRGWLEQGDEGGSELGYHRLEETYVVYRYLYLALGGVTASG